MKRIHSSETRAKIGKAIDRSSWRLKSRDKSSAAPSVAGNFDEDYRTPYRQRSHSPLLWEERS